MKRAPGNALAPHLYIHVVEASPHPERADASANRLRDLAPGLGHLVHMPSHIDIRRGRWQEAITANEKAIEADTKYRSASPKQGFYGLYIAHNRHMLSFAAMIRGESELALGAIRSMVDTMPPDFVRESPDLADGFLAMPVEVLMRFGRWDEIVAIPEPAAAPWSISRVRSYSEHVCS